MTKGRSGRTVRADYFRELYRTDGDPWKFASSAYEREKYRVTLEALPRARYRSALELGCSIGVFTALLAERCDALVAVDVSVDALAAAARRCAHLPHVLFTACDLATAFPKGRYDLVTFCEIGFYFCPLDLRRLRDAIAAALFPGADLIMVHWTPAVDGHALSADEVHADFKGDGRFVLRCRKQMPSYRLDVFART